MTSICIQRCILIGAIAATICTTAAPASAQNLVTYRCGAKPVAAAFFPEERNVRIQLDGKSMTLKQRISVSGVRYSKSGVQLWIKGKTAMLKRRGQKWVECASE